MGVRCFVPDRDREMRNWLRQKGETRRKGLKRHRGKEVPAKVGSKHTSSKTF